MVFSEDAGQPSGIAPASTGQHIDAELVERMAPLETVRAGNEQVTPVTEQVTPVTEQVTPVTEQPPTDAVLTGQVPVESRVQGVPLTEEESVRLRDQIRQMRAAAMPPEPEPVPAEPAPDPVPAEPVSEPVPTEPVPEPAAEPEMEFWTEDGPI